MTTLCPCCGKEMSEPRAPISVLMDMPLSNKERKIVRMLADAYPRPVSVRDLINMLFVGDTLGTGLKVYVCNLRKRLPEYGWNIPRNSSGRGHYGAYRLEPVE